ncbi:14622_t:CDS:2 [Acaulospora colombiana]|uniref:14622_t:CDS:1 n=1 Tax=Acaulospora colombiana TaxID=27376 RepID=A0ACA9LG57_9GLOM|nr:14622_t:CDS:2 [Acaulospora colombiana]
MSLSFYSGKRNEGKKQPFIKLGKFIKKSFSNSRPNNITNDEASSSKHNSDITNRSTDQQPNGTLKEGVEMVENNHDYPTDELNKLNEGINQLSRRFDSLEKRIELVKGDEINESLRDILTRITESFNQKFDSLEKRFGLVKGDGMDETPIATLTKITESVNRQSQKFDSLEKGFELIKADKMNESITTALNKITERIDSLEKRFELVRGSEMNESDLTKITESINRQFQRFDSLEGRIELMKDNSVDGGGANEKFKQNFESLTTVINMNAESIDALEKRVEVLTQKVLKACEISKEKNVSSNPPVKPTATLSIDSNLGTCKRCHSEKSDNEWCLVCDPKYFIDHFSDWTSGNPDVDRFIQATQRNASNKFNFLEWIPYTSLKDVSLLGSGGFGTIYSAIWVDGPRSRWLHETNGWGRYPNARVALKSIELKNYQFDTTLLDELQSYLAANKNVLGRLNTLRVYGVTRKPEEPENYMIVMLLGDDGDLDRYINKNFSSLTYFKKLEILFDIITGVLQIHQAGLVHRDLHRGNIMCQRFVKLDEGRDECKFVIGDLGLTRKPSPESKVFYGVVPYCAPEVLESAIYSEASDIYSFGMLMWELAAGVRAFSNRKHDESLMFSIIFGLRPQPIPHIPNSYKTLMERCWAPNQTDRPSAQEIYTTIGIWLQKLLFTPYKGISQEFLEADEKRLVRLSIEGLSSDEKYHSKTYHTVNRMGFTPLPIGQLEDQPPVKEEVESDDDWVGAS